MSAVASRKRSFAPLVEKAPPRRMIDGLGWCTWDAFYSSVDATKVERGLSTLEGAGVKVRRLIVDDGWMQLDRDTAEDLNLSGEIMTGETAGENAATKMRAPTASRPRGEVEKKSFASPRGRASEGGRGPRRVGTAKRTPS